MMPKTRVEQESAEPDGGLSADLMKLALSFQL